MIPEPLGSIIVRVVPFKSYPAFVVITLVIAAGVVMVADAAVAVFADALCVAALVRSIFKNIEQNIIYFKNNLLNKYCLLLAMLVFFSEFKS